LFCQKLLDDVSRRMKEYPALLAGCRLASDAFSSNPHWRSAT
jgi:hypothetical protein